MSKQIKLWDCIETNEEMCEEYYIGMQEYNHPDMYPTFKIIIRCENAEDFQKLCNLIGYPYKTNALKESLSCYYPIKKPVSLRNIRYYGEIKK